MDAFDTWLERLLAHGESVQTVPPAAPGPTVARLLDAAYRRHAADVAGSPPPFEADAAASAAVILAEACWALSAGGDFTPSAAWGREPSPAGAHLSADLLLRFLPGVLKRAQARDREGDLSKSIEGVLRRWPLSGVLADLDGGPTGATDFAGHAGLQMLYAERLLRAPRAGWVPPDGPAAEWVHRVFADAGKVIPKSGD